MVILGRFTRKQTETAWWVMRVENYIGRKGCGVGTSTVQTNGTNWSPRSGDSSFRISTIESN